ncbi:MAG: glycoside hydrolase [Planctomycetes bacterium]|nr:glycoside hydrolase [Planctomycetota bacterium]
MPINPPDLPLSDWSARWIWQAEAGPADGWMCLRKTFDLAALPDSAIARIAVDSKYWLWINGELVVREGAVKRGPTPTGTWFDAVDLTKHLVVGENAIAVLVWYWGKHGFSHQDSGQGGLLFEADIGGRFLVSDRSWRVLRHPAFGTTAPPHPNYRLSEHSIRFDARADILGWTERSYRDSDWPQATEKGSPPCAPWGELWPRTIPQWRDHGLTAYTNAAALPKDGSAETIVAELPYNCQLTPFLEIEAPAGLVITMRTDHYCGGGNDKDFNVRAEYITTDGRQSFESPGWMNGHRVLYDIPEGIRIVALKFRESGYDCSFAGSFRCDDPFYNTLWEKARRTLYVTMRDTYMDCPDRERAQWWGDAVIEIEEAFYALDRGADRLGRKAILDLVRWQREDRTLFSPIPTGNYSSELPQQMLAAIGRFGFWTYMLHSGDTALATEFYPHVRAYLSLWELDGESLIVHRKGGWDWGDWGTDIDVRLLDNTWYCIALEAAIRYAKLSGDEGDIKGWRERHRTVVKAVQKHYWTVDGFRSPEYQGPVDDRGNALAVLAGIASRKQWPTVTRVLMTSRHASPYLEKYVLEALFEMDQADLALRRMRDRYQPMVDSGLSTLWEFWTTGGWGSSNHAWAGGPLSLLSMRAAGITPTAPGYATFRVAPRPGTLRDIEAEVVTVRGVIRAHFRRTPSRISLDVTVPASTHATIDLPTAYGAVHGITINGMPATATRHRGAPVLGPHPSEIEVGAGTWTISANVGTAKFHAVVESTGQPQRSRPSRALIAKNPRPARGPIAAKKTSERSAANVKRSAANVKRSAANVKRSAAKKSSKPAKRPASSGKRQRRQH